MRILQIMPADPGWRVLHSVINNSTKSAEESIAVDEIIGWALVEDDSRETSITGFYRGSMGDRIHLVNDSDEGFVAIMKPEETAMTHKYTLGLVYEALKVNSGGA